MREMGMEMRERIARAVYEGMGFELELAWDRAEEIRAQYAWPGALSDRMKHCLEAADAVLAALMEPTEAMLEAAFDVPARSVAGAYAPDGDIEVEENGPTLIWQAMLNAAAK